MFDTLSLIQFLALGALSGFLGGLIGIGGGFVLVPGLYYVFTANTGLPSSQALPLALGTTMACMVVTSWSSARAQAARGTVRFDIVKRFAPWVAFGTVLGAVSASLLDTSLVKMGFAAFCLYASYKMLFSSSAVSVPETPEAADSTCPIESAKLQLPGTFFGWVCGLNGVGGATLFVNFLHKRGLCVRQCMATASALQVPISIVGTVSYLLLGLGKGLPSAVGYVHLPGFFVGAAATYFAAPFGVSLAHALPVQSLKKLFGVVAATVGLKMAGVLSAAYVLLKAHL